MNAGVCNLLAKRMSQARCPLVITPGMIGCFGFLADFVLPHSFPAMQGERRPPHSCVESTIPPAVYSSNALLRNPFHFVEDEHDEGERCDVMPCDVTTRR